MRVLIVNRGIFRVPPESSGGGAEKHGYYLANQVAQLGHEVHFVGKTRPDAKFHPTVNVERVPPGRGVIPPMTSFFGWVMKHLFGNILSFGTALRILAKNHFRFQIIHCHGALTALLLSRFIGWKLPVVYTMHDPSPWIVSYTGKLRVAFRKLSYLTIDVPCLRSVRNVIAVCPALREEARRWGVPASRVTFIPNAVPAVSLTHQPSTSTNEYGLFVGQLVRRKRIDLLIEATKRLADQAVRLVVVGEGPEMSRLVQLAAGLGVAERISFTGHVTDEALANYYSGASFFALSSSAEGLPTVALEAMSYGLPIIAPKSIVYNGILLHDVNSLIFDPGNIDELVRCVRLLSSGDDLRQRLSSNATWLANERFSWAVVAKQVVSLYEQVASKGDSHQ